MADTIRVGRVGCGEIAVRVHVPAFKSVRGVQISGLCDPDERRAEALRRAHGLDVEVYAR